MPSVHEAIDAAINEVSLASRRVVKIKGKQIRGIEDIDALKATALTWFYTHKKVVLSNLNHLDVSGVDASLTRVLDATAKSSAKATYVSSLKDAKAALIALRSVALVAPIPVRAAYADDLAPDFSSLAGNQQMRDILARRWDECAKCVRAEAHLAGIVMMGGLLEALFVARANKLTDKTLLTNATNAPRDKSSGKVVNYQDWMLDSYIRVGFELNWVTESAKDVADKLKEYRNFVHPAKELRCGVTLGLNDSTLFWQVTKVLARQLLMGAK